MTKRTDNPLYQREDGTYRNYVGGCKEDEYFPRQDYVDIIAHMWYSSEMDYLQVCYPVSCYLSELAIDIRRPLKTKTITEKDLAWQTT